MFTWCTKRGCEGVAGEWKKEKFALHASHSGQEGAMSGLRGAKQDLHSGEDKFWQAWGTCVKRLGERRGLYWWGSPGKMRVGAGLCSCGDALSMAAIWGSDSGLVFLLHNQFAVWIPLHITLNIHSSPDPCFLLLLPISTSTNFA